MRAPKSFRSHIGIFGRRNVGKSSILNALAGQEVSIVSDIAGTTTDPVEKPMELHPVGPVIFIDTAGIDDVGELGDKRGRRTISIFDRADLGLLVANYGEWGNFEEMIVEELKKREVPMIVVFNKCDLFQTNDSYPESISANNISKIKTSAIVGEGIDQLRLAILDHLTDNEEQRGIIPEWIGPGELVLLVVPIDTQAPKGRLVLPQVQTIRELLDKGSLCLVCKDTELADALSGLHKPPRLIIADSQVFKQVAAATSPEIPLTSFSILFARYQGDLLKMVEGAMAIDKLKQGDKVMIAEACSHHPSGEDIGTVKIPRWLSQHIGGELEFIHHRGHDFPEELSDYKLIIHCGACMLNRREMLARQTKAQQAGVALTNYGLTIAYSLDIFERALQAFPTALNLFHSLKQARCPGE